MVDQLRGGQLRQVGLAAELVTEEDLKEMATAWELYIGRYSSGKIEYLHIYLTYPPISVIGDTNSGYMLRSLSSEYDPGRTNQDLS